MKVDSITSPQAPFLEPATRAFYKRVLELLNAQGLAYLVGGAYAFERYTGIARHTKDFDIFIRRGDYDRFAALLDNEGYHTELSFPHWLGKAFFGEEFIDLIFSGGNGIAQVDDGWFENSVEEVVFDVPVRLCPAEEIIWSKSFVMERERYDGADIAHLIHASGHKFDWNRLLERFGSNWRVLYTYLILFGFIYPFHRSQVPEWVMKDLAARLDNEEAPAPDQDKICQGTLISRGQFLIDVDLWKYKDARLKPIGKMSAEEIAHWTAAIGREK